MRFLLALLLCLPGPAFARICGATTSTTTSTVTTSSTSTTSTSTSSTTTTSVIIDDFQRGSLGGNWASSGFGPLAGCAIVGSAALSATGVGDAMCFWASNTPPVPGYACAKLSGAGVAVDFSGAGACLGVDNASGGDGACCIVLSTGGPLTWELNTVTSGSSSTSESGNTPTFGMGDFIGIQRTSATAFRCYSSSDGTTWTALGSGVTVTVPNPGAAGADASATSGAWTLEVWEEGAGSLPTSRACGTP